MNADGAQATQDDDMDKEIERMEKLLEQKKKAKKLEQLRKQLEEQDLGEEETKQSE